MNPHFIIPFYLLPGAALLIFSTSMRYSRIHSEFHHMVIRPIEATPTMIAQVLRRSTLLHAALKWLYYSAGLLVVAGLVGGLSRAAAVVLTVAAVLMMLYAIYRLLLESKLALSTIREHKKQIETQFTSKG